MNSPVYKPHDSPQKWIERVQNFKHFLGPQVLRLFVASLIIGVMWFAVETSFIVIFQGFLSSLNLIDASKALLPSWYPQGITENIVILFVFGLFRSFFASTKYYISQVTNIAFIRYQRSLLLNYALHNAHIESSSQVMSVYIEKMARAGGVLQQISIIINAVVATVLFLATGFKLAPMELVAGIVTLGLLIAPFKFLDKRISSAGRNLNILSEKIVSDVLSGMKNFFFLRLYGLTEKTVSGGQKTLREYENITRSYSKIAAFRFSYPQFAGIITICVMTAMSSYFFHTPGAQLLSVFYIFIRLSQSIVEVHTGSSEIRYSWPGFRELYQWSIKAALARHKQELSQNKPQKALRGSDIKIKADNVNFSYDGQRVVLNNISFEIGAGDLLLIQGPSGAGKSTLVSLIVGILNPQSGQILINNSPVEDIRQDLLGKIGYVGPEPYLIPGSVKDNLMYGHTGAPVTEAQIWQVLEKSQMSAEIRRLSKGLDENLLETTQLSTGQKQRMAIARALLREPKLLILDEATANLDSETESRFIDSIQAMRKDLVVIVISHRDSFSKFASKVIRLGGAV